MIESNTFKKSSGSIQFQLAKTLLFLVLVFQISLSAFSFDPHFDENDPAILPIIWSTNTQDRIEFDKLISGERTHPLALGREAFTYLYEGRIKNDSDLLNQGLEIIRKIDAYPYKINGKNYTTYLYPEDHMDFVGKKWWSGMANSSIALAYLLAYDIFGEQDFKNKAMRSMQSVINPVAENGSGLQLTDQSVWYLEYADAKRTEENSLFVHNGFLYSLLAINYFYEILGGEIYADALKKGVNALNEKEESFILQGKKWTYYMLNPLTLESFHYIVYELMILDALAAGNPDKGFREMASERRKILNEEYSLFEDQEGNYYFNMLGAPHLYWPDIYPTTFTLYYPNGEVSSIDITTRDYTRSLKYRLFPYLNAAQLDSVTLHQNYNGHVFHLTTLLPKKVTANLFAGALESDVASSLQCRLINRESIEIFSENPVNRAMTVHTLTNPIDLYSPCYFGWVLHSEVEIVSIKLDMITTDHKSVGRYYIPQPANKHNVILIKGMSFPHYANLEEKKIEQIQINYYYNQFEDSSKVIEFSEILVSDNPISINKLMRQHVILFNFEVK